MHRENGSRARPPVIRTLLNNSTEVVSAAGCNSIAGAKQATSLKSLFSSHLKNESQRGKRWLFRKDT